MDEVRRAIARIVQQDLAGVLDRTMDAYDAAIPSVATADAAVRSQVREATKRTILSFIALYADPTSPARVVLQDARRVTLDRAGQSFEREDILAMLSVARQVMFQAARNGIVEALDVDPALEHEISAALEAFMTELERDEHLVPRTDAALRNLLWNAEQEGQDLG